MQVDIADSLLDVATLSVDVATSLADVAPSTPPDCDTIVPVVPGTPWLTLGSKMMLMGGSGGEIEVVDPISSWGTELEGKTSAEVDGFKAFK